MTMQIRKVVLYHVNGEKRELEFNLGRVNIITGDSGTGKTTLINIIEYCLGRSTFSIRLSPDIRRTIAWYGVLYQFDDRQVFIAKEPPTVGLTSRSEAYYQEGTVVPVPDLTELENNTNDDAIVKALSTLIGISPNITFREEGQSRNQIAANIKHTTYYLYQPENVIGNVDLLFYRQSDTQMAQTIKDTLPYFIGAVREDHVRLSRELRAKRRDLKLVQQELKEKEDLLIQAVNTGMMLLQEAQQVGLLDANMKEGEIDNIKRILRRTLDWQPTAQPAVGNSRLAVLQQNIRELRHQFEEKRELIEVYTAYSKDANGYLTQAYEQRDRLASVNLFENHIEGQSICPLCSSPLTEPIPTVDEINRSLSYLQSNLETVEYKKPDLEDEIRRLEDEREAIRQQIRQAQQDIQAVSQEQQIADQYQDLNSRISRVVGRISLFIDITPSREDELADLRAKVANLEREIAVLDEMLSSSWVEDLLRTAEIEISQDMTSYSKKIIREYEDGIYRLDFSKLTVVISNHGEIIRMAQELGSTENVLGAHLVALLALRKYFIEKSRPVPGFLILDQPSIAYFPDDFDQPMDNPEQYLGDRDRRALELIFNLVFDVCESLAPNLQIIVLDHANYPDERFQDGIVEKWRHGVALIPQHWIPE